MFIRSKLCLSFWVAAAVVVFGHTHARAQAGTASGIPIATDLRKVATGSWSEYAVSAGQLKMKQKFALVASQATTTTLEVAISGGPPGTDKMAVQFILESTNTGEQVKKHAIQVGS